MNELGLLADRLEAEYRPRFEAIDVEIDMWGGVVHGFPFWRTDYGLAAELSLPEPWCQSGGSPYCDLIAETKRPWGRRTRVRSVEEVEAEMRRRLDLWLAAPWESPGPHPPGSFVFHDDLHEPDSRRPLR
jgi:hypothetical protein